MKRTRGYILILTILVMSAVFFISTMFIGFFRSEHRLALRAQNDVIAQAAAEAGIQDSLLAVKQDSSWDVGFENVILPNSRATYTVTFDRDQTDIPFSTSNIAGTAMITGYDGREVYPGMIHLVSIGRYGESRVTEEALITASGLNLFDYAVFVDGEITMNGNVMVDSFDSRIGDYNASHTNSDGHIATNAWHQGAVSLVGNVDVYGNVGVGPDGIENVSVSSSGNSTYMSFSADPPRPLPFHTPTLTPVLGDIDPRGNQSVNPPPGTYNLLSAGAQTTVTLTTGTYVILGDLSTVGQGRIVIPPGEKVELFVLGDVSLGGNSVVNGNSDAASFIVYGGPNTTSVTLNGIGTATMAIYAPAADFRLVGNANIYGALVGNTLSTVGNSAIHYDKALGGITGGGGSGGVQVLSQW